MHELSYLNIIFFAFQEKQLIQKYTLLQNQLSMKNNINSKYNE